MAVYFDKSAGNWVDLPEDKAQQDVAAGNLEIPLQGKDGKVFSAPMSKASDLIKSGEYQQPHPDVLQKALDYTKYSAPDQQAKTFVEGAARAGTFGLSDKIAQVTGISTPEDQLGRSDVNPGDAATGEMAGLLGSTLLPAGGAAGALAEFGNAAKGGAEALGAGELLGGAAKLGAEGAAYQSGNELSKMFRNDPNQTMQTAAANIGLSALMAPAIGGATAGLGSLTGGAFKKLGAAMQGVSEHIDPAALEPLPDNVVPISGDGVQPTEAQISPEKEQDLTDIGMSRVAMKILKKAIGFVGFAKAGVPGAVIGDLLSEALGKTVDEHIVPALQNAISNFKNGINPEAFNSVINTAQNAARGLKSVEFAVRNVMAGKTGEMSGLTDSQTKRLEKASDIYNNDPTQFINAGQSLAAYEPNHATAQSVMFTRAMNAISAAKPKNQNMGMLDTPSKPSQAANAVYKRTLQTVEDPLSVLNHVTRGTVTGNDVATFKNVYPDLHRLVSEKMTNQIIEAHAKGKIVPYKTRLGISTFMGMPMDSTMNPHAIAMNQPLPMQAPQQGGEPKSHGSKNALSKMPGIFATQSQSREQSRAIK